MKKIVSLALSAVMACGLAAGVAGCAKDVKVSDYEIKPVKASDLKVGLICLHDETSTYDKNFIDAMDKACTAKGVSVEKKLGIPEDNKCFEAAEELVGAGCNVIFADSFGHEDFMMQAAIKYPNVQFCHATGTKSKTHNLGNYHNAFASIYEGRYLAGVVAGLKLNEIGLKAGKDYYQMGYVGAFPYAEVISGFTSFYLGAQSVANAKIEMEVQYTSSWYDVEAEQKAADNLITRGAQLISQHADSMGAPNACEAKEIPNVSYNMNTSNGAPKTYLVASRINWQPYFEYMIDCVIAGDQIETDWTGTIATGSVELLELGKNVAAGTAEKVAEVKAKLESGEINVFDASKFTVGGKNLTSYLADVKDYGDFAGETEVIKGGVFLESKFRSAPYFNVIIDNIKDITPKN